MEGSPPDQMSFFFTARPFVRKAGRSIKIKPGCLEGDLGSLLLRLLPVELCHLQLGHLLSLGHLHPYGRLEGVRVELRGDEALPPRTHLVQQLLALNGGGGLVGPL